MDVMRMDSQSRIYAMLEKIQKLAGDLPLKYQQRLPNELLSSLASSLVHGQIFEIVKALTDVQQGTEKQLFQQRLQLLKTHSDEKMVFQDNYQSTICYIEDDSEVLRVSKDLDEKRFKMVERHRRQIKQFDSKLIAQMDQKVSEQQVTLEKAGVPGFHVTNNPNDVQLQMHLLDFIRQLDQARH